MHPQLDVIAQHPDDDDYRLAWADGVGGERGELVRLQCELSAGTWSPAASRERRQRVRALLQRHGKAWAPLQGLAKRWTFRRGFVEWAEVDARSLVEQGDELLAAAPLISSLEITGLLLKGGADPLALWDRVLASPWLALASALSVDIIGTEIETDSDFQPNRWELETTVALERLLAKRLRPRAFGMKFLNATDLANLLSSGMLSDVEALELRHVPAELLDFTTLPLLTSLQVGGGVKLPQLVEKLPATLRELGAAGIADSSLLQLAQAPLAGTIEHLHLHHGNLRRDASAFAAFPSLRSLDLGDTSFGDGGYGETMTRAFATFTAAQLPALRELRLSSSLEQQHLLDVATAFGEQLELLDLRGHYKAKPIADELRAKVAGDVLLGGYQPSVRPLRPGRRSAEPCWDHHVFSAPPSAKRIPLPPAM